MFSTRVTGLYPILSGRESVRPLTPEYSVPSQNASTTSMPMPADLRAADDDSTSMSSMLLSQCSPNDVQPMPTIATRSRMPLLAMSRVPPFPEAYHAAVPAPHPGGSLNGYAPLRSRPLLFRPRRVPGRRRPGPDRGRL